MSDRRDIETMLAQLESDMPFDHTEGLFSNRHPGFFGTDFRGVEWSKKLAEIEALKEELASSKAETASLKAEMEGHKGTITTLTDETKKLRTQLQQHLTALTRKSQTEFNKFSSAFQTFLHEIEQHVHDLQTEKDEL